MAAMLLVFLLTVEEIECGIPMMAAAAGGGARAAAGYYNNQGYTGAYSGRNATMDLLSIIVIVAFAVGVVTVGLSYCVIALFRKYVLKIPDPPESFVMEKKIKCRSGHNMMLFHVPRNVSAYIQCGSKTACDKKEHLGDFAAWHSCPVCAYRICDGCANADETEHIPSSKNTVEFLLVRQFANFGKHIKKNKEMEAEDIAD